MARIRRSSGKGKIPTSRGVTFTVWHVFKGKTFIATSVLALGRYPTLHDELDYCVNGMAVVMFSKIDRLGNRCVDQL